MPANLWEETIQLFEIAREERIRASVDIVFETILEELGPLNVRGDGTPMPMKIELWPGGRWYRDLGENNGHLWGHVQAIKRPTLLEVCGPLMMSLPVANNVQYRLSEERGGTLLKFAHRALGPIAAEMRAGMNQGWGMIFDRIRNAAEKKQ